MNTTTEKELQVETGDIVTLKTGSQEMVLDEWLNDERVICKWYEEGEFRTIELSAWSLVKT